MLQHRVRQVDEAPLAAEGKGWAQGGGAGHRAGSDGSTCFPKATFTLLLPPVPQSIPLVVLVGLLGIGAFLGREQLEDAVKHSGSFLASQLGTPHDVHEPFPRVAPTPASATGQAALTVVAKTVPSLSATRPAAAPATKPSELAADTATKPSQSASATAAKPVESVPATAKAEAVVEMHDDGPWRLIREVHDTNGQAVKIWDRPIPEDCHPEQNMDYAGDAVVWGLGHKQPSATDCCRGEFVDGNSMGFYGNINGAMGCGCGVRVRMRVRVRVHAWHPQASHPSQRPRLVLMMLVLMLVLLLLLVLMMVRGGASGTHWRPCRGSLIPCCRRPVCPRAWSPTPPRRSGEHLSELGMGADAGFFGIRFIIIYVT
jgi:hypothetical protein